MDVPTPQPDDPPTLIALSDIEPDVVLAYAGADDEHVRSATLAFAAETGADVVFYVPDGKFTAVERRIPEAEPDADAEPIVRTSPGTRSGRNLVRVADETDAELIVVPQYLDRRGGLVARTRGHTLDWILRHTSIPVALAITDGSLRRIR